MLEPQVTNLKDAVTSGSLEALVTPEGDPDGILLGKDLAAKLGVGIGDDVSVLTPQETLTPAGCCRGRGG